MEQMRSSLPQSKGDLRFLACELEDLASVQIAAKSFLQQETRLDVLVHNAGVMMPPEGSVTKQGHELQFGVHVLAPLLLTKFLMPIMVDTAKSQPTGSVRVVWVASSAAELFSPPGGVEMDNIDYKKNNVAPNIKYGTSKAAMYLLAKRYPKMNDTSGVVHIVSSVNHFLEGTYLLIVPVLQSWKYQDRSQKASVVVGGHRLWLDQP